MAVAAKAMIAILTIRFMTCYMDFDLYRGLTGFMARAVRHRQTWPRGARLRDFGGGAVRAARRGSGSRLPGGAVERQAGAQSMMTPNPLMGVGLHAVGGLAAGSFYAPLKRVRGWQWESFWLVMGLAAWLLAPWAMAWATIPHLGEALRQAPPAAHGWAMFFGLLWGVGNLTFGLSVRYLGMALGYAISLGFCAAFGTLIPPLANGAFLTLLGTASGRLIFGGVVVCLLGIAVCGRAGMLKERDLAAAAAGAPDATDVPADEFTFAKGFLIAVMAGVLSACFSFGLTAGAPIAEEAVKLGAPEVYRNNAVLVVILIGGFASNAAWCVFLNVRHRSARDYVSGPAGRQAGNYALSLLGGGVWYLQFFFYGMGTTNLGETYGFSSWSLHMAFIILCSNAWGLLFREWRGTRPRTRRTVWLGLATLLLSIAIIGAGNYVASRSTS